MTEDVKKLFQSNIRLLTVLEKSVLYFREQKYDIAMEYMPKVTEGMKGVWAAVIEHPEYFSLVSTDTLTELLEDIINASRNMDYVLLADLLEIKLYQLLCKAQEVIIANSKQSAVFEVDFYKEQCQVLREAMERAGEMMNAVHLLQQPINPQILLEKGYGVEYCTIGLMTAAVGTKTGRMYLHTNQSVTKEGFQLARTWADKETYTYLVQGFGMGYHVAELAKLVPEANIEVYEQNGNILKLACAFAPLKELLSNPKLSIVYDEDGTKWKERLEQKGTDEKVCVHLPSVASWSQII